jgi:hypothetical protein
MRPDARYLTPEERAKVRHLMTDEGIAHVCDYEMQLIEWRKGPKTSPPPAPVKFTES